MCKTSKKLLIYDHMIGRLTERFSAKNQIEKEVVLAGWTSTALMKYLYIACVISTNNTGNKSLFDLFDNFVAFPHGPVEIDTYYNRGILVRYNLVYSRERNIKYLQECKSYRNEQIVQYDLSPEDQTDMTADKLLDELIIRNGLEDYKAAMDASIDKILEAKSLPDYCDTTRLIEVSHQILWNEAWASTSKQLRLDNDFYMQQEREAIEKAVQLS